ncbi:biopolymer transporter ExbD [Burkholderiaceae bacterium DAT-1]|nr:biopolymer transporter ExbD [Burkholderiaceae bacterium DAT-1]
MNFRRGRHREEPEMNLIPLIDVMLVILIFLMATTTYSKFADLKINLPTANAEKDKQQKTQQIDIAVTASGQYAINNKRISFGGVEALANELRTAAQGIDNPLIVINADGSSSHQSVVNIMEAARLAGYARLTFTTQTPQ